MKRKTAKRSLAAVLSVLTACGNFVFVPFSISAADADATVYLQTLYLENPDGVAVVGSQKITAGERTVTYASGNVTYSKAIRQDTVNNVGGLEESSMTFSIGDLSVFGSDFTADVGMQAGDTYLLGDAVFKVYVDGVLTAKSGVVSYKSEKTTVTCYVPATAKTLTIAVDCYDDTACDWCVWGDPRLTPRENAKVYLSPLARTEKNKVQTGYGSYTIRYNDTESREFSQSIYNHAAGVGKPFASVSYDVESIAANGAVFKSYNGLRNDIDGTKDTNKYGKASFLVYADDVLLETSEEITPESPLTRLCAAIPSGTKTLTLAQDPGTSQDCDWCVWGDPYIYPSDIVLFDAYADKTMLLYGETEKITVKFFGGDGEEIADAAYTASFESADSAIATVSNDGTVTARAFGTTEITLIASYGGKEYRKTIPISVTAGAKNVYLADLSSAHAGSYTLRYANTGRLLCEKGLYIHAGKPGAAFVSATYDIAQYTAADTSFHSYIGFLATNGSETDTAMRGLASFVVYADGTEIAKSDFISPASELSRIDVLIPKGTKILKIALDPGEKQDFDWCLWGDPYLAVDEDYENRLSSVFLSAEKTELSLGESVGTSLVATLVSGSEPDLSKAKITYSSSAPDVLSVGDDGTVTALSNGTAILSVKVEYNSSAASAALRFRCGETAGDITRYLGELSPEKASVGWGALTIDRDLSGNKIHFANDGDGITCEKGLMTHAPAELIYDIEHYGAFAFRATVGITDDEAAGKGLVQFFVYADDTLLYQSAKMTNVGPYEEIDVTVPDGTKTLRLVADSCGDNASDHSAWGNARILLSAENGKNVVFARAALSRAVLPVNETAKVSVTGLCADGSALDGTESITYKSENEGVFTVDGNGVLTGVSDGIAMLCTTIASGNSTYTTETRVIVGESENGFLFHFDSPDGTRTFILSLSETDGALSYMLCDENSLAIAESALGIVTDKADFTSGLTLKEASTAEFIEDTYTLTAHTKERYTDNANERRFTFTKDGAEMTLVVRLYNDGAALRYILSSADGTDIMLKDEKTSAVFLSDATVWAMPYTATLEGMYGETTTGYTKGSNFSLPALVRNGEKYVLLTESGINPAVSGTRLYGVEDGLSFVPVEKNATVSSPFTSTWRVLIEGSLADVTESSLVTAVAEKPDESIDYSFVEPGMSAWSWDEVHFRGQADPDVHKKYIDYAAEMGWKYYTLDYGWQKPDGEVKDGNYKVLPGVHYDWVPDVIAHAKSKGVKLIGWVHRVNLEDEAEMNAILEDYKTIGLAGIKADFFNSESAETMKIYDRLYRKCAQLGLIVNCHGANKPTGEVRTYPNVIAREGIKGDEYAYYDGMWASQYTIIPFLRSVTGPADVTEYIYPRLTNKTTCGSQMALSVLVTSGLHYMGTPPEKMLNSPAKNLYTDFPTVFDDRFLLDGEVGKYALIAARYGDAYYIGGITTDARTAVAKLDFLNENTTYFADIYKDGNSKDEMKVETKLVKRGDELSVDFLENGGAIIRLRPISTLTAPESIRISEESVTTDIGESVGLSVITSGEETPGALLYSSSNEKVARIENGIVYAVGAGIATVRVSAAADTAVYAECRVNVRRSENAVSGLAITAPESVKPNESFTVSFKTPSGVSKDDISFIDGSFKALPITSSSEENGVLSFVISMPCGEKIGVLDARGTELGFFTARAEVTILYDGAVEKTALSGETITLKGKNSSGDLLFVGWKIGDTVYAAETDITVPFGVSELSVTSVFADPTERVTLYIDAENGKDENEGLTKNSAVRTVSRAFSLLDSYGAKEQILTVIGFLSPARSLPQNSSNITITGADENAVFNVGADGIAMNGDLSFRDIRFECNTVYKFFDTMGHTLVIGENVSTEKSPSTVMIHSGTMNSDGPREHVTIKSGTFRISAGAFYNVSKADKTDGADYIIDGGNVTLHFCADKFSTTQHGTIFTDGVNVVHNGGNLLITTQDTNGESIVFEKPVTLIQNYGNKASVKGIFELCTDGYYVIESEKYGACRVEATSTEGVFRAVCDEGVNAFADKVKINDTFTAQSDKITHVTYRPDKAAKIGENTFDTLSDAVSAAKNGDTVTLLQSAVLSENITVQSGVSVDLDGFAVSGGKLILSKGACAYSTGELSEYVLPSENDVLGENRDGEEYRILALGIRRDGNTLYFDDEAYTVRGKNGSVNGEVELYGVSYTFTVSDMHAPSLYAKNITISDGSFDSLHATDGGSASFTVNGGRINTVFAGSLGGNESVSVSAVGGSITTLYASGEGLTGTVEISIGSGNIENLYKTAPNGTPAGTVHINGTNGKVFTGWDENERAIFMTLELLGMQLRTTGVQGLRFIAELRGDKNGVDEYGVIVLPELLLNDSELTLDTERIAKISSKDSNFKIFDSDADSIRYTVCITGIEPKNYDRRYCVRAYMKYTGSDGEHIVYTDTMPGDILSTAKGICDRYPGQYEELYERILNEYAATFVSVGEFKKKVEELSESGLSVLSLDFTSEGKALGTDGSETENADWSVTDYLSVSDFDILQYCLSVRSGVLSLAFYDADKTFINGVSGSTNGGNDGYTVAIYQKDIPENASFVRLSRHKNFDLTSAKLSRAIGDEVNGHCLTKDQTTFAGKKILCVGDSLTYGDYGTTVPGRGYPHNENYPYYLAKYTGASVEWYARGGYTATNLYGDYHDGIFSGAGRDGEYSAKDADFVIVMLGTNGGLTKNGKAHFESYRKLVEGLKKDMKAGAKLILMTPPHATKDPSKVNYGYAENVSDAYGAVYALAKEQNLPVFDVYRDSGLSEKNETLMQPNDGLHFGGVGYSTLAAFVTNELKLLVSGKLDALSASEETDKADTEFLSTIEYPAFSLCDGKYKTFGRWFKKTVNGAECDVTTTTGSQIFFLTNGATTFTVDFKDETQCKSAKPYFAVSIDGGEPTRCPITENTITLPDASRHAVWLFMDGLYEREDKWNGEVGFAVAGISVNAGTMRAIEPTNDIVFYYGDSITEGVNALGTTTDGASNSATGSYAYFSARELSAIPYYIGYGESGLVRPGSFKEMKTAIEYLSANKTVDLSVVPSYIVINHGYNDAYSNSTVPAITSEEFSSALAETLELLNKVYPDTEIFYIIPINGSYRKEIYAAEEKYKNLSVIETKDLSITKHDGIHPDKESAERMGKAAAEAVRKIQSRTHVFDSYITYRSTLQNTAKVLHDEKKLTVAYFGGSVTAGYGASDFDTGGRATDKNSWRAKTTAWLSENFPDAEIESIYAAIGESGTYLGTYIVQDYVIAKNPDLVFIEYAINDTYGGFDKVRAALQLETIVREIKTALPKADIVILLSGDHGQLSGNAWYFPTAQGHADIAEHYNLPLVYMGRALYDHITKNSLSWDSFYKDNVHPLDAGYAYYFEVVKEYLGNALLHTQLSDTYKTSQLPALYSDHLLDGDRTLVYATEEMLEGNDGWSRSSANINPVFSKKGSIVQNISDTMKPFTYTFNGTELAIYTNLYSPVQYELTVDGETSTVTFSGHNPTTVVSGLSGGEHTVTIKPIADTVPSGTTTMQIDAVMYRDETKETRKNAE